MNKINKPCLVCNSKFGMDWMTVRGGICEFCQRKGWSNCTYNKVRHPKGGYCRCNKPTNKKVRIESIYSNGFHFVCDGHNPEIPKEVKKIPYSKKQNVKPSKNNAD